MRTYRSITVNGDEIEFSGGFTEMHTRSYEHFLSGSGFRTGNIQRAIQTVFDIRNATPLGLKGDYYPLAGLALAKHPFEVTCKPANNH